MIHLHKNIATKCSSSILLLVYSIFCIGFAIFALSNDFQTGDLAGPPSGQFIFTISGNTSASVFFCVFWSV